MEKKIQNETKKLISDLLQKLLDRRLNKLEKRNKEEESTLKLINKESQKAIIALEECSHKVRKQIYLIRNKYVDERRNHNTLKSETSKTFETNKTNNNMNNINTNLFNNLGNDNLKKPEIYHHEKEEKLKKFKKRNSTASPKMVKNKLLEEKMKTIQKSIRDLKAKYKSTKNIKKVPHQKNFLTMETTPKKKSKNKITYTNSKKKFNKKSPAKFSKTLTNFHINTQNVEKKDKKENKNNLPELNLNELEKDEDLRLTDLKLELKKSNEPIIPQKTSSNQINEVSPKSPIRELKDFKDESLLICDISKISNISILENEKNAIVGEKNDNKNKNIDNNNNNNIDNNNNNNIDNNNNNNNIDNNNNNINNIDNNDNNKNNININDNNNNNDNTNKDNINNKDNNNIDNNNNKDIICDKEEKINIDNKNEELNINKKNDNINNVITSKKSKKNIEHLIGDSAIEFTLIEQEKMEGDEENNKTIDLNISGLSDQLTLEEKFQSNLDDILIYLDTKDICKLLLINKESFKTIMNFLISKTEIKIDIFEEELSKIIEENKSIINIDINNIKTKKFDFSANSSRAISLLNTISVNNFLKIKDEFLKNKEIFIIFNIFFIAEGKNELMSIDNMDKKWEYIFNFFKEHISNQAMGTFIEKELNGKTFNENIINSLYKYAYKHSNIISPNHFQKINKDIAILVFIIKDMLEFLGILTDSKLNPEKEIILINSRLQSNKEILEKLNQINNKIN